MSLPADQSQRARALDPECSFIVQAPAGSGKTELLTRRYLSLLARVDHPEEILAITFTRKAAAEMRLRIIETLSAAIALTEAPETDFEREGYELAMAANRRDQDCGWELLSNPARLRVQTIDSFCSSLVRQMPVLSQFGAVPEISENASRLYDQAADQLIDSILREEQDPALADSLDVLLTFVDNKVSKLHGMIATMLQKRDQWLRHVSDTETFAKTRAYFEHVIRNEVEKELALLVELAPVHLQQESLKAFRYSQSNLRVKNSGVCNEVLLDIDAFPGAAFDEIPVWQGIADSLLTNGDALRKRLDKNAGFPAGGKGEPELYGFDASEMKARKTAMSELLGEYAEHPEFVRQLVRIRTLPASVYSDDQWALLEALTHVLRSASAWLLLRFMEHNAVDFTEVAARAQTSLGDETDPTDLALSLDYRIRHLLIDEFQDTSLSQFTLFRKLTTGWTNGDGHTFFAVGDPMQSIYRFREAQVALFMQARNTGINDGLQLEPLTLSVNFRSRKQIIDWVNASFGKIFPAVDVAHQGAVSYASSIAAKDAGEYAYVKAKLMAGIDRDEEAAEIATICRETIQQFPDEQIAILLRTKTQAVPIIKALQESGILYSAVDIESLRGRPVVQDILSLLQALLHPSDRIHWFAVLRAPWCGLLLSDIFALVEDEPYAPVWNLIGDDNRLASLSSDGCQRLQRVREILDPAMSDQSRGDDADWLESVWRSLGGEAIIDNDIDAEAAKVCFRVIRETAASSNLLEYDTLEANLDRLFAPPSSDPAVRVQLMSIHKSKGLEFPTVIMPGLERKGRPEDKKLLNWIELAGDNNESELLLAPIDDPGAKEPILGLVLNNEKIRAENELLRLLYVGTTRARERLWLTACVKLSKGKPANPTNGSLLASLLPALDTEWTSLQNEHDGEQEDEPDSQDEKVVAPSIKRLPGGWVLPENDKPAYHALSEISEPATDEERLKFLWASSKARHVGTVVHRQLQRISDEGMETWDVNKISACRNEYQSMLAALGVESKDLAVATTQVIKSLEQSLGDERGQWVLGSHHESARSELALTAVYENKLQDVIIDRTFVDESGTRWIIDYKTGAHSGGGLEDFLDEEVARYKPQLEKYAAIMAQMEDRPIKLGLYFPLHPAWREWEV